MQGTIEDIKRAIELTGLDMSPAMTQCAAEVIHGFNAALLKVSAIPGASKVIDVQHMAELICVNIIDAMARNIDIAMRRGQTSVNSHRHISAHIIKRISRCLPFI